MTTTINWVNNHRVVTGDNFVALDNGQYLYRDFGKYKSGLVFVLRDKWTPDEFLTPSTPSYFNLPAGDLDIVLGDFWVSKKGTPCFRPKSDGTHVLIRDAWGGCFNDYRGGVLPDTDSGALYYHRASSHGGGSGYDYCVVPYGWRVTLSEDDI